jgi:hypothetical protein
MPAIERTWAYVVKQADLHTAVPLVLGSSFSDVEIATEILIMYKSPGTDQILVEFYLD